MEKQSRIPHRLAAALDSSVRPQERRCRSGDIMSQAAVRVLLLGENVNGSAYLWHLNAWLPLQLVCYACAEEGVSAVPATQVSVDPMKSGRKCLGAPALRPREFVTVLDEMLEEIRIACIAVPKGPQEPHNTARTFMIAS